MRIARRLFVVVLADNDHGKTHMMNALLSQGLGSPSPGRKGYRVLRSPWGRRIFSYVFVRSFQETERGEHRTVEAALDANDPEWRKRELIIFPSHVEVDATRQMLKSAHNAGFDVVCAAIVLGDGDRRSCADVWDLGWDERWTVPNRRRESGWEAQVDALAGYGKKSISK